MPTCCWWAAHSRRGALGALVGCSPFAWLPLAYERVVGGPSTWNPVGVAYGARNRQGKVVLPNLQAQGLKVISPRDVIAPVGFGPIAPVWPSWLEKLDRYASEISDGWRVTTLRAVQPQATLGGCGGTFPIALPCDTLWIGQVSWSHPQEPGRV